MKLPGVLTPLRSVRINGGVRRRHTAFTALRNDASPTAEAPPNTVMLPVQVPVQALSNWCWAAVASAVATYYQEAYAAGQCEVASRWLQRKCCPPGADDESNVVNAPYNLVAALADNLARSVSGQISWEAYQYEIRSKRPVCFIIDRGGGSGHVIVGCGFASPDEVCLDDPSPAAVGLRAPWAAFCHAYGDGRWVGTLMTKRSY